MKIGLINTKSQTMTPPLLNLGMAIKKEYPDSSLSSFSSNFSALSASERTKQEKELQKYVDELDVICCINNSLPFTLTFKKEQRRILYAIPYDSFFNYYMEDLELGDAFYSTMQTLSCFTEIHYFSEFQLNTLKKLCPHENTTFKQAVHYPNTFGRPLASVFPSIKEKKVIGLFTITGTKIYDCQFDVSALSDFIKGLPSDYAVVTNNSLFFEQTRNMPLDFAQKLLYVPASIQNAYEMLSEIDILLTDYSAYATMFSKDKKPFWGIPYKNGAFIDYLKEMYPALILDSLHEVTYRELLHFTEEHAEFMKNFCITK